MRLVEQEAFLGLFHVINRQDWLGEVMVLKGVLRHDLDHLTELNELSFSICLQTAQLWAWSSFYFFRMTILQPFALMTDFWILGEGEGSLEDSHVTTRLALLQTDQLLAKPQIKMMAKM